MTRREIIDMFREECPEVTERVITDAVLGSWCEVGDKEICARARLIVDQDGTIITTSLNSQYFDLPANIPKCYSIDEFPGGGVLYNNIRLEKTTISELDSEDESWRSNAAGTPEKYYVRGKYIYLDRPIDSNAEYLKVYSVLISDDFNDDNKTPFNQIAMYEPYHYAIVLYLIMRAKTKVGKPEERDTARKEYEEFIAWVKKEVGGMKYGSISLHP